MKRLDRIKWTDKDMAIKMGPSKIGMFDLCDSVMKTLFRVNDDELDFMCGQMTDEEFDLTTRESLSYSEIRSVLNFRNKYMKLY